MRKVAETQIKVRAGQVWIGNGSKPTITRFIKGEKIKVDRVDQLHIEYNLYFRLPTYIFYSIFDFSPQNDLEWLACDITKWMWPNHNSISRRFDGLCKCQLNKSESTGDYTRHQWQNMRYYLGLDEKPHCKLIDGEWVEQ